MTSDKENHNVEEPNITFKTVRVFNSFEEADEYEAKKRASMSHDERLRIVEELRKKIFSQYLLPDGKWPTLSKKFKISTPHTDDTGQ